MNKFNLKKSIVGGQSKVYFIADIAANHDGSLQRALKLIELAKKSGADAAKFQHHNVKKYVSDTGFKNLKKKFSHQKKWKKSIFEVYKDAEVPTTWTKALKKKCNQIGIDFFSTPYDLDMVDHLNPHVNAFKIGSGDVAWNDMLKKVASKKKPVFFATGAADLEEVKNAYKIINRLNKKICIMQCNTNYTGSLDNFNYINLNVLKKYKKLFPNAIIGLSDHTPGHETVLGAIALGIKVVEKHFTDDISRNGPDHPFSMDPKTWKEMVVASRKLESAMGDGKKKVEKNELDTVILQRRAVRCVNNINKGKKINFNDFEFQRPCPKDALKPNDLKQFIGKKIKRTLSIGDYLKKSYF